MKKTLSFLLATILIVTALSGCGTKPKATDADAAIDSLGEYVLTTESGMLTMFDAAGKTIDNIDLGGTAKSNYIYAIDQGRVYSSNLTETKIYPQIIYAVDKTTRKLSVILSYKNKLTTMRDYILDEGNIDQLYGYNGILYYSARDTKIKANQYSIVRPQILSKDGKLSYAHSIPVNDASKSTYIYMENLSADYLQFTGLDKKLLPVDIELLNYPKVESSIYELPGDIESWVANTQSIYFFDNLKMGQYNMENNQILLHYGPIRTSEITYTDGINKRIYNISDFDEGSSKSLLMVADYDKMGVNKIIDLGYSNPMTISVDKSSNIYIAFKNTVSKKNFSQLKAYKYGDYSEMYSVGIPYLPTKIVSKGETVYLFNPFEDSFYLGAVGSSEFKKIAKDPEGKLKYTDIFAANPPYIIDYIYDESGRMVNRENFFVNSDGKMINQYGDRINSYNQRIDENGRAINKDGEYIDKYNNILDINGKIIKYTATNDGNYYNEKGQFVDSYGTVLVRTDAGDWVLPSKIDTEIVIEGHYDEFGNFIVNSDVLDKYPDAYEIWMRQKTENKTIQTPTNNKAPTNKDESSQPSSNNPPVNEQLNLTNP